MQSHFTSVLLESLKEALAKGEQAILFQNRRGYSPTLRCNTCGWHSECINCDVSLTYHKWRNNLQCHYCGYQQELAKTCPACGAEAFSKQVTAAGFQLKGSGWYVTDFKGGGAAATAPAAPEDGKDAKPADKGGKPAATPAPAADGTAKPAAAAAPAPASAPAGPTPTTP